MADPRRHPAAMAASLATLELLLVRATSGEVRAADLGAASALWLIGCAVLALGERTRFAGVVRGSWVGIHAMAMVAGSPGAPLLMALAGLGGLLLGERLDSPRKAAGALAAAAALAWIAAALGGDQLPDAPTASLVAASCALVLLLDRWASALAPLAVLGMEEPQWRAQGPSEARPDLLLVTTGGPTTLGGSRPLELPTAPADAARALLQPLLSAEAHGWDTAAIVEGEPLAPLADPFARAVRSGEALWLLPRVPDSTMARPLAGRAASAIGLIARREPGIGGALDELARVLGDRRDRPLLVWVHVDRPPAKLDNLVTALEKLPQPPAGRELTVVVLGEPASIRGPSPEELARRGGLD